MSFLFLKRLLLSFSLIACAPAFALPTVVDVTGIQSYGKLGDPLNTVLLVNVGAYSTINRFSYNVNLTADFEGYLRYMAVAFSPSDQVGQLYFTPGARSLDDGPKTFSGDISLADLGFSIPIGADGILRLEFYQSVDFHLGVDGSWNFGNITFFDDRVAPVAPVPEPASFLLIGAGLAVMGYAARRRRTLGSASKAIPA